MAQSFTIGLWKLEYSIAHGSRWIKQRDCARDSAQDWLDCYQADDPSARYLISEKKPKLES